MSRQIPMEFGDGIRAAETWSKIREALGELVDRISLKEAAYRLGLDASMLHKKLGERDRHQLTAREMVILLVTATVPEARETLTPLAEACGFDLADAQPLTPEQTLERVLAEAREEYGPSFEKVLKRAVGSRQ